MAISFLEDVTIATELTLNSVDSASVSPQFFLSEAKVNGTNTIALRSPASLGTDVVYTLPVAPTVDGHVLTSLINGTMSWAAGGGGGTNIGTNDLTITDQLRTLTLSSTSGYKFSILQSSGTESQEWYRNASSIWTNLKIESTAGTAGKITFLEANTQGTDYIALKAPDTVTSTVTYTLPEAPTAVGEVLTSSTAGVMSWTTVNKNYRNTIVTNSVNLVARNQTWTNGQWLLSGSGNKSWTYFEWFPYTGTFNIANGWPTNEVAMAGVKIGSLPQSGTSINLSATITAVGSNALGGASVTGRVYVFQYRCSVIAADSGNHTSVPVQSDSVAFNIADTGSAEGVCVSLDFTLGLNMAVGDYYVVAVNATASTNMLQNDPVWFSYNITQLEAVT